jgi:hypothetical protein
VSKMRSICRNAEHAEDSKISHTRLEITITEWEGA